MNSPAIPTRTIRAEQVFNLIPARRSAFILSMLLLICAEPFKTHGQSDDFDDGNNAGWTHLDLSVVGSPVQFTFPDDGFGGKAYRVQTPAPPVPGAGPARAFTYRTNIYTDFYVAADVLGFDNSLNQAFGFLFRATDIGLGQTDGYVFNYDPQQASGGRGQLQINLIEDEVPTTLVAANITFNPARRYRFVLSGAGSILTGRVFDFGDLTRPLVTITADESTYPSGVIGLFNFSRVNAAGYTNSSTGKADTTFDSFIASSVAPTNVPPPGLAHPLAHYPQVVNRSPASFANFHSAASGIAFTATTLTTNTISTNAIQLFLNGAEVSSGLALSGNATSHNVTYNGLQTNRVYDARIVLADSGGRSTTNDWTFDTFTQGFLSSTNVKVIEAEDYNYNGGQFQDSPPPSGLDSGSVQVNGNGVGYYNLDGVLDVDFFDRATSPGSGQAAEYRQNDFVGTQAGATEADAGTVPPAIINDTIRQQYAALNLPEYQVRRTEGTEWLNYTRSFPAGNYNVYLRAGNRAPQTVNLDRVTSDPTQTNQSTAPLGVFNVPDTGIMVNFRYVPLTDTSNGNPAVLNLSGTNTLRLTIGGSATNVTQYTLALNYLAFVPATVPQVVLLSAADVSGTFAADNSASINTAARTVTVPRTGNTRFYRLQFSVPPASNITGIQIAGTNVVINYQ